MYPWSGSPAHHVTMWQRVRGIFWTEGLDARTVQWVWAVNHDDVGGVAAESYHPGDTYVDWIGVDGDNWGESQPRSTWRTPPEVFGATIGRLRALAARPLAQTETASSTSRAGGADIGAKSAWITPFFDSVARPEIDARMIAWVNEDKETDWAVFGGARGDETVRVGRRQHKAYRAYRDAVQGSALVESDPADARLLSDERFAGVP